MNGADSILVPDRGLVGVDGAPLRSDGGGVTETVGIDLYEAPGGADAIQAVAAIQAMRTRRERKATLVVAPGHVTVGLLKEVAVFNAEVYRGVEELGAGDRARVEAAVEKRHRRAARRAGGEAS